MVEERVTTTVSQVRVSVLQTLLCGILPAVIDSCVGTLVGRHWKSLVTTLHSETYMAHCIHPIRSLPSIPRAKSQTTIAFPCAYYWCFSPGNTGGFLFGDSPFTLISVTLGSRPLRPLLFSHDSCLVNCVSHMTPILHINHSFWACRKLYEELETWHAILTVSVNSFYQIYPTADPQYMYLAIEATWTLYISCLT